MVTFNQAFFGGEGGVEWREKKELLLPPKEEGKDYHLMTDYQDQDALHFKVIWEWYLFSTEDRVLERWTELSFSRWKMSNTTRSIH